MSYQQSITVAHGAIDHLVTVTQWNLAPALINEFDVQSRIHGVRDALVATSALADLLDRPARGTVLSGSGRSGDLRCATRRGLLVATT